MLDFFRTFDSATGHVIRSLNATSTWSAFSLLVSVSAFFTPLDPLLIFTAWAVSGALIGYGWAIVARISILPFWSRNKADTSIAATFTADYLVGAGGAQLTTGLLGFVGDARILSGVRGAGTLLGPINLISTTARSMMLPFLARNSHDQNLQIRSAVAAVVLQVLVLTPLLLILQFIPDSVGEQLLGETWQIARIAILPMSIDAIFNVIMTPAIAGHRVAFAGIRSVSVRLAIGLPRPFIILFSAYTWGIVGATWAMAAMAIIGALVWWISYHDLCRRNTGKSTHHV